jgi:hypothetical protein
MGGFEVVIIVGPVEVGGHYRDKVAAVLPEIAFTEFDACDLCEGVGKIVRNYVRKIVRKNVKNNAFDLKTIYFTYFPTVLMFIDCGWHSGISRLEG